MPGPSPTLGLVFALVSLLLGPMLYGLAQRARWALFGLDGFVLTAVGSLVLLHIGPHALSTGGLLAFGMLLVGLFTPVVLSWTHVLTSERAGRASLVAALLGLAVHAAIDGSALAGGEAAPALFLAVLVHRFPAGILMWWLARPVFGMVGASAMLVGVGLSTVLGFAVGQQLDLHDVSTLSLFEALIAGVLLHVLVSHGPELHADHHTHSKVARTAEVVGAVLGVLMVVVLPEIFGHAQNDLGALSGYGARFVSLLLASAPALLLGYFLSGLITTSLPRASVRWVGRGPALLQSAKGVIFGLPIPICSCGVLPVYEGLVRRGIPVTAGLAFLVATPELGVESLLLSLPLLGGSLTAARLVAAFFVALTAGWVAGSIIRSKSDHGHHEPEEEPAPSGLGERLKRALDVGFVEVVDHTAAWIVLGLAVAALLGDASIAAFVGQIPDALDVPVFALLGMPLYVCASGATPIAAGIIMAGASPGAAIAFLLVGPATNVTTFGVLSKLHGRRGAIVFATSVLVVSVGLGYLVNLSLGSVVDDVAPLAESHGLLAWLALAVLALVYAASFFRQGPRGFLLSILAEDSDEHDHHDHDHSHPEPSEA